jgi:hypothetical protein
MVFLKTFDERVFLIRFRFDSGGFLVLSQIRKVFIEIRVFEQFFFDLGLFRAKGEKVGSDHTL